MADDLEEVRQRFIADMSQYVDPIEAATADVQEFGDKNEEAAAKVAGLDHEIHDQTESYFALAAAIETADRSSGNLSDTLKRLGSVLDDSEVGDLFGIGVSGSGGNRSFQILTDDAARSVEHLAFSETRFRDAMLEADEASIKARGDMDAYKGALDRLKTSVEDMERGPSGGGIGNLVAGLLSFAGGGGEGGASAAGGAAAGGGEDAGALAALGPALGPLLIGAVAIGPVIMAIVQELGFVVGGFLAAGAGAVAFGALAYPTIKTVFGAVHDTKAELDKLPAGEREAVNGIKGLIGEYQNMAKAFEPDVLKTLKTGLHIAKDLLGQLPGLATPAAGAIEQLLKKFQGFVAPPAGQAQGIFKQDLSKQLTPFETFMRQLSQISPGALTAIGTGIGNIATNLGNFITAFPKQDYVNAINIFFRIISGSIRAVTGYARGLAHSWDEMSGAIVQGWQNARQWTLDAWHTIDSVFHDIRNGYHDVINAGDSFSGGVARVAKAVKNWFERIGTDAYNLQNQVVSAISGLLTRVSHLWDAGWSRVVQYASTIGGKILHALGNLGSLLTSAGRALIDGLIAGIEQAIPGLSSILSHVRSILGTIGGLISGAASDVSAATGIRSAAPTVVSHNVNVNVGGATMADAVSQQALQRHVQSAVLTFAKTNGGSMLVLPGQRAL